MLLKAMLASGACCSCSLIQFIHSMCYACQYSKCMLRPVGVNVSSHRLCFHEMAEISSHRIYFFKCSYMNICDFHAYTSIFVFYVMCRFSYSK